MSTGGKRPLLVLFSVITLDLIGFGVVMPILPFYAVQYGATATVLGWLLTSYSLMQFLFASLWGRLSDRFGRKPVLLMTIGGSCLSLVLLGTANSLWVLFAGRILSGFFAANISVASAFVADLTDEKNRAAGMGLIGAAFGVGFILGPALGGVLSPLGYHVPILAAAVLSALNLMYASIILQEPKRHEPTGEKIRLKVLKRPAVFRFSLIYFIFTLGVSQLESVFAFYMMDRFLYDAKHVGYILAGMAVIMVGLQGGLLRGLVARFGERLLLVSGLAILAVGFFFIPLAPTVLLLAVPLAVASVGRGISQPALMSLVSLKASREHRGIVMGTFQASASLARVMGPLLAGFSYDRWHAGPFYLAAVLLVLALGFGMTVREDSRTEIVPISV